MKTAPATGITLTTPLVHDVWAVLSHLNYDGRAEMLAALVAKHALENTDPDVTPAEEAKAIASGACEIIDQATGGGSHAH